MSSPYFISYSAVDAEEFALKLYDKLLIGPPVIPVWIDKHGIPPGQDWDEEIKEAIRSCAGMIFVMTPDSVESGSVCQQEWSKALSYKKPVIPLLLQPDAETPFRLETRQHIDFTGDFNVALAKLRDHLKWLASPEGELHALKGRLADAKRDLRRADETNKARVLADLQLLEHKIQHQERIVKNPEGEARRVQNSIERAMERERQPERPVGGVAKTRFINPRPGTVPTYFQNRTVEIQLIGNFIKEDSTCMLTVVGRGGIGKTAMVCKLLKSLENWELPDDGGPLPVDGIIYLSETGSRKVNAPNLFSDLCRLLPEDRADELKTLYKNPSVETAKKTDALLAAFPSGRVLVLLDNFEDKLDPKNRSVEDEELDETLRGMLGAPAHTVKIILTTRLAPRDLALTRPEKQKRIDLDKGLESPYAENILREMDIDGKLGLKAAPEDLLNLARERTLGNPRALEALFAILSADRDTTLEEILVDAGALLPENVVNALVGEAYNRLDAPTRMVMRALAIYARPVPFAAMDYLLQPYLPGVDSAPVLNLLVNMHFVRKESGRYYLHPVDQAYAISRVPPGRESDRNAKTDHPFTRFALLHRAANYFKETREPRKEWKTIEDLAPQLAEFDLRCEGGDFDTAARVLLDIDFDYLLLWGYYRLMVDLHKRLQSKLEDPDLKERSVGNIGSAYLSMGKYNEAIVCYNKALDSAREMKDRWGEPSWLGNMGVCYATLGQIDRAIEHHELGLDIAREIGDRNGEGGHLGSLGNRYADLGQVDRAIDHYDQALLISREIGDRNGEGNRLGNLGNSYAALGQIDRAIDHHEQALVIAREIGDRNGEGIRLGNLGLCYASLGQIDRAIEHQEQALVIAREIGDRNGEGIRLGNLGNRYADLGQIDRAIEHHEHALVIAREIGNPSMESDNYTYLGNNLIDQRTFDEAIKCFRKSIKFADEIRTPVNQNEARCGLALACLYSGDFPGARAAIEEASQYDYPANNHRVLTVLGITALIQRDAKPAREAFMASLAETETLLEQCNRNYDALDSRGLAFCGMALLEKSDDYIQDAREAFNSAREIISAVGCVKRVARMFEELKKVDDQGVLGDVWPEG